MTSLLGVSTASFGLRRSSNSDPPAFVPASPVSPARSTFTGSGSATTGASLLFPINPAFNDGAPAGGILLNKRRPSDTPDYVDPNPAQEASPVEGLPAGYAGSPSPAAFKVTNLPTSPALSSDGKMAMQQEPGHYRSSSSETVSTGPPSGAAAAATATATRPTHGRQPSSTKIRFAPLPTPNRKRSLSTGRNIVTKAKLEPDGTRTLERFSKQDGNDPWVSDDDRSAGRSGDGGMSNSAVEDEDEEEQDDDGGAKKPSSSLTSSSWMTMGMGKKRTSSITSSSYTYTKKLLKPFSGSDDTKTAGSSSTADAGDSSLTFGLPLRKTISTGGMMGASPLRTSGEQERRRSFLSAGSSKDKENKRHMRNGSTSETPDFSSLSSSLGYKAQTDFAPSAADMPKSDRRPVRMLNGRVYGAKKGQASTLNKEPEFSEWGGLMGAKGGGLGSNAAPRPSVPTERRSGFLDDEDDGSGMGWVKRRREQKERERRASELATPDKPGQGSIIDDGDDGPIVGSVPALRVTPPHWPESFSPGGESERSLGPEFSSTRPTEATIMEESSIPGTPHEEGTGAMAIKMSRSGAPTPHSGVGPAVAAAATAAADSAVEDESGSEVSEDDDEDDEDEDAGDFESDDDDDEVELEMEGLGANSRYVV